MTSAALERVKAKFKQSLHDKADKIEQLTAAAGPGKVSDLTAALHKLSGSAGFYGEHEIANLARALELRLSEHADTQLARADLDILLQMLRR